MSCTALPLQHIHTERTSAQPLGRGQLSVTITHALSLTGYSASQVVYSSSKGVKGLAACSAGPHHGMRKITCAPAASPQLTAQHLQDSAASHSWLKQGHSHVQGYSNDTVRHPGTTLQHLVDTVSAQPAEPAGMQPLV